MRVYLVVGIVTALRVVAAFRLPLDHDEAYYWLWGQQLAWSYVDHPPMVAWLARLGSVLGPAPGFARLPFIACEAAGALAVGAAAEALAGVRRAALPASLVFLLLPQAAFQFGEISPDAPYLCAWAFALLAAANLARDRVGWGFASGPAGGRFANGRTAWRLSLGIALGIAMLSRMFALALVAGVVAEMLAARRPGWRRDLLVALSIAIVLVLPSLLADAHNGWATLAFTFHGRASGEGSIAQRLTTFYLGRSLAYAAITLGLAFAFTRRPGTGLLRWTAVPLTLVLAIASLFDNVLPHWLLGPFTSIAVGIGVTVAAAPNIANRGLVVVASVAGILTLAGTLFLALPENAQAEVRARVPAMRGVLLPDPAFADAHFAADARALAASAGSRVMTDYYDIDAALTYAGDQPLLTGAIEHRSGDVLRRRQDDVVPERVLFVGPATLAEGIATSRCAAAYRDVRAGPLLAYRWGGVPVKVYDTLLCSDPKPDAGAALFGN